MSELFLDIAFTNLCRTGEAGTQRNTGKQREPVVSGQDGPTSGVQDRALDLRHDMLVVQSGFGCSFAIPRGVDKDRIEVDLGEVQSLFECMHGAGLAL